MSELGFFGDGEPLNEDLVEVPQVEAPAPDGMPRQWSWDTSKLLWVAAVVVALGFAVYTVMSFTQARASFSVGGDSGGQ